MVGTTVRCFGLFSMIWSVMTVLSANAQLDGPGQITISPQTGVPGETFIGSCSSLETSPGISLRVRWLVRTGTPEN